MTHYGINKLAKGKYPIVEDRIGRIIVPGAAVGGGAYGGYKLAKKLMPRALGISGIMAGGLAGAALYEKLKGLKK